MNNDVYWWSVCVCRWRSGVHCRQNWKTSSCVNKTVANWTRGGNQHGYTKHCYQAAWLAVKRVLQYCHHDDNSSTVYCGTSYFSYQHGFIFIIMIVLKQLVGSKVKTFRSFSDSINQSINHKALSSRATSRLKCYGNNAVINGSLPVRDFSSLSGFIKQINRMVFSRAYM